MANEKVKGPASYFPSIEKNYGKPIAHWQDLIRKSPLTKHMELVNWPRPWTPEQSRDRLADYAGWLGRSSAVWHGDVGHAARQRILPRARTNADGADDLASHTVLLIAEDVFDARTHL